MRKEIIAPINTVAGVVGRTVSVLLALLLLSTCSKPADPVQNLLFICIDTVRYDVFSALGEMQQDPLHELAADALVFTDASAAAPWTVPSLATAFSGLWPPQHGAGQFPEPIANLDVQIPSGIFEDAPLLAEALQNEGFETTVISAHALTDGMLSPLGFDRGIDVTRHFPDKWRQMVAFLSEVVSGRNQEEASTRNYDYLHFMEAHNWHIEDEMGLDKRLQSIDSEDTELFIAAGPPGVCKDPAAIICKRYLVYVSAVNEMRSAIAATIGLMAEQELLESTLIVLIADHGEEFTDHDNDPRVQQSSEAVNFVGHSHSLYQELIHVPMMIWHPELEGRIIDSPVNLIDLAPTLADWLGVDFHPAGWGGVHLDHAIQDSPAENRVMYATGIAYGEQQISTREGKDKSIWYSVSDQTDYFDLSLDPGERNAVISDELIWYFDALLNDFLALIPTGRVEPASLSNEQIRRLQAIGYLQGVEVED